MDQAEREQIPRSPIEDPLVYEERVRITRLIGGPNAIPLGWAYINQGMYGCVYPEAIEKILSELVREA